MLIRWASLCEGVLYLHLNAAFEDVGGQRDALILCPAHRIVETEQFHDSGRRSSSRTSSGTRAASTHRGYRIEDQRDPQLLTIEMPAVP